jgi:hypothetical protein
MCRSRSHPDRRPGKITLVRLVWSRLFGDKRLRDRRVTRYGFGYVAWFPALLMGLACTAFGVGTVVDGTIGWNTLGNFAVALHYSGSSEW